MKWSIPIRPFSRDDTNFLKGIAILLIVLHNYFRWVNPVIGENEFWFSSSYIWRSYIFLRTNPLEIFHIFFDFLGHYGVQAFMVASAYGLTLSYQEKHPGYGRFILHRFNKLYPSLVFAGIVFIIFTLISTGNLIGLEKLGDMGIQFTLFANLIPGKAMVITGPWWFYSFIFQFYLIFPLLMWINRKSGWMGLAGLVIIGYIFTILMYQPMVDTRLNPYMMFIGHMPELCLGIFLATRKQVKLPVWLFVLAVLIFVGGNIYEWLWPFANLGVAVILIVVIQALIRYRHRMKHLFTGFSWIGIISMYLFACHGFIRYPFINLANLFESPLAALLIGLIFVLVASGVSFLMMYTEGATRRWIGTPEVRKARMGRFLFLFLLVAGSFAFLFFKAYQKKRTKELNTREVVIFSAAHDFETPVTGGYDLFSDSVVYEGSRSLILSETHNFSPGFVVDFDTIDLTGLNELDLTTMLYASDLDSQIHLVMEIIDRPTGERMEWKSEFLTPGKFNSGEWFLCRFNYKIPQEYRMPNYRLKFFIWNPGKSMWYADDLVLVLKARRTVK
ncbi:MAG: acyltransferase [Bacteroidetes bacterium]|nr:acyltransferase [Bacteroidota bacterium]